MPRNLFGIYGVSGLIVAVGENHKILHWAGGAYQSTEQDSPTGADLLGVWVHDPCRAYAVGRDGTILRWDGLTWQPVAVAGRYQALHAVWGASPSDLWIAGYRALFHVQPGGSENIPTGCHILGIWGSAADDVWMICSARLALHWDGTIITLQRLPGSIGEEYRAIGGSGPDDVWAVGLCGLAAHWNGAHWVEVESGSGEHFTGIACLTAGNAWVTTQSGRLLRWTGELWQTMAVNPLGSLNAVCRVSGVLWCAGARGVVMRHLPGESDE